MIRKFFLPSLAALGVTFAVYTVLAGQKEPPPAPPAAMPTESPYAYTVAGAGIIEASTENIAVGTTVPGVVTDVLVKVGDKVKAGTPLFVIDDRDLRAELVVRQAAVKSALAKVNTDEQTLADLRNHFEKWQSVTDQRAVTKEELDRKRYAVQIQDARLAQARADTESAAAQVKLTETEIERRIVRAPVDGELLQVKIRKGEYAPTGVMQTPLMLIGAIDTLHVRVDIDESDAWRVRRDASAVATVRGNRDLKTKLKFVRIEPYVVPKKSLTGDSTERVDTRVLQVLYSFDRKALPVYVGQQVDVSIEAKSRSQAISLLSD